MYRCIDPVAMSVSLSKIFTKHGYICDRFLTRQQRVIHRSSSCLARSKSSNACHAGYVISCLHPDPLLCHTALNSRAWRRVTEVYRACSWVSDIDPPPLTLFFPLISRRVLMRMLQCNWLSFRAPSLEVVYKIGCFTFVFFLTFGRKYNSRKQCRLIRRKNKQRLSISI